MKNVKIYNKQNELVSDQNVYDDPTEFVNHIVGTNYFGKPIRWVRAKIAVPPDHDGGTGYFVYPDEQYDDVDVVATEERPTGKPVFDVNGDPILENGVPQREAETGVQLKAEYEITIEDVTEQIEKDKRIAELKRLLADSDWTVLPDVAEDKGAEYVNAWKVKRKTWRDEIGGLT